MWIIFALGASVFWGISYVLSEEIYKKISIFTSLGIASFVISITTLLISNYQPCGKEPLALFSLKIKNSSGVEKEITTDSMGKFQIELSPGKYTISQANKNQGVIGGPFLIEVKPGLFIDVNLEFQEMRP
jgi:hypothetical protein